MVRHRRHGTPTAGRFGSIGEHGFGFAPIAEMERVPTISPASAVVRAATLGRIGGPVTAVGRSQFGHRCQCDRNFLKAVKPWLRCKCGVNIEGVNNSDRRLVGRLDLPDGLLRVEAEGFRGCTSIDRLTFPPTLVTVEAAAFEWCTKLVEFDGSGAAVASLGKASFYMCTALKLSLIHI